jgi:hypothetical protein
MRTLRLTLVVTIAVVMVAGVSRVAAGQDDAVTPPTEMSGVLSCGSYYLDGASRNVVLGPVDDGNLVRRETRGSLTRLDVDEMSDVRLAGEWTVYESWDEYIYPGVALDGPYPLSLVATTLRMVDDEGAWEGSDHGVHLPGVRDMTDPPVWEPMVLSGEGAYEGLIAAQWSRLLDRDCDCWAVADPCTWEVRGYIIDGRLPPLPDVPAE